MLPPFVPPGARKAVPELLPSIQEFAVDRRSAESAASALDQPCAPVPETAEITAQAQAPVMPEPVPEPSLDAPNPEPLAHQPAEELPAVLPAGLPEEQPSEEQLPSIEAFLLVRSAPEERVIDAEAQLGGPPAQRGAGDAPPEVFAPTEPIAEAPGSNEATQPDAEEEATEEHSDEAGEADATPGVEAPIAVEVPALSARVDDQPVAAGAPPQSPPEDNWLDTERNSVDWAAAGRLGAPAPDDSRAAAEWSATDWDSVPSAGHGDEQHVAAALAQVARRIRGGELRVEGAPGMSVEAALASALSALLRKG